MESLNSYIVLLLKPYKQVIDKAINMLIDQMIIIFYYIYSFCWYFLFTSLFIYYFGQLCKKIVRSFHFV